MHARNRIAAIEESLIQPANISFNDVAGTVIEYTGVRIANKLIHGTDQRHAITTLNVGLEEAKSLLREALVLPIQYPHLFTGDECTLTAQFIADMPFRLAT